MADPWDTVDTSTLPVGANRSDRVVGRSETGGLVYQTIHGQQYSLGMGYQPARKSVVKAAYNALRSDPLGALAGAGGAVLNSLANTISVPANALAGRPVTYGDVMDVAGMVQLGGAAMPAPKGALRSGSILDEYAGSHRAPKIEDGATLDNPTVVFGADIYSPRARQYFGTGNDLMDAESIRTIQKMRGNPNAEVLIYRAIPKSVNSGLNSGDWVTTSRQYAIDHGDSALGGDYKIVEKKVKASELATDGNSIHEWGWWGK
jgi:hypothetical protein